MRMPIATGRFLLFSLIVAVLAGLLFTPGLPGDFVFDDFPNIVNNEAIQLTRLDADALYKVIATPQISGSMRGLPTLTFALDFWRAGGADPATFKTTNIAIHVVTACALAWFFRTLLLATGAPEKRSQWLALALAMAWAAHPLQVSSVLYVVQRLQTMGTMFLVLALLAYLKARQAQIEGRPARSGLLVTALLWVLALGCKEDSVQLPIYTLALELTVLRFGAKDLRTASLLRRGYLVATLAAVAVYFLWVIPHRWHWDAYGGRDFSTPERLLTQARVLCMYLWQIVVPLPQHMPFYYDWVQPSRGFLQPWTTLPAIATLLALLGTAWRLRMRWPLFSLGVFLFFGAHFITSNVVGLELAFEHRNNFALIGAVLAVGSLLGHAFRQFRMQSAVQAGLCAALLVVLGTATIHRAGSWNSALSLARTSTEVAPHSARAWISLCAGYYKAGGVGVRNNPFLDQAIEACRNGAASAPYALNNSALLVVLKTLRGDVSQQDWDTFQQQLDTVHMSWDNQRAPLILTYNYREGVKLDKQELLKALATLDRRTSLKPFKLASLGYFVMNDLAEPDLAMPYFTKAIEPIPVNDPFPRQLISELRAKGRPDLAEKIISLVLNKQIVPPPTNGDVHS
jgi:hypothetical protein